MTPFTKSIKTALIGSSIVILQFLFSNSAQSHPDGSSHTHQGQSTNSSCENGVCVTTRIDKKCIFFICWNQEIVVSETPDPSWQML